MVTNLPRTKLIEATDIFRVEGRVAGRVEAPVLRRELRTDEQIITHLVRHELAVRLEVTCKIIERRA